MGGGREEVWGKTILDGLIGLEWVLLGNPFIPICKNLKYSYPSIHRRVWVNLTKWVCLTPIVGCYNF